MRNVSVRAAILALLITPVAVLAQDEAKPKPKPKTAPANSVQRPSSAHASLVVFCDLACGWTVDGEHRRTLVAGGAAHVTLELGQHFLTADTLDNKDHYEQDFILQSTEQSLIKIKLGPIRNERLWKERYKAEQDRLVREAKVTVGEIRKQPTWTDPASGLMWTREDTKIIMHQNGRTDWWQGLNWTQAKTYCRNLTLAGHSDWRLPTINDLISVTITDARSVDGFKGGIVATEIQWSSTPSTHSEHFLYLVLKCSKAIDGYCVYSYSKDERPSEDRSSNLCVRP
jgi:hypothetical protein